MGCNYKRISNGQDRRGIEENELVALGKPLKDLHHLGVTKQLACRFGGICPETNTPKPVLVEVVHEPCFRGIRHPFPPEPQPDRGLIRYRTLARPAAGAGRRRSPRRDVRLG